MEPCVHASQLTPLRDVVISYLWVEGTKINWLTATIPLWMISPGASQLKKKKKKWAHNQRTSEGHESISIRSPESNVVIALGWSEVVAISHPRFNLIYRLILMIGSRTKRFPFAIALFRNAKAWCGVLGCNKKIFSLPGSNWRP
jgi:hypothetical protein